MQKHQYWMDKESLTNISAKWFLIMIIFSCFFLDVSKVKVFDFKTHFPHSNFQLSELPTR